MARVALLGGSFDPPHFGHLNCIKLLLDSKLVDQVWLVPSAMHKDKLLHASIEARKEMLELLLNKQFAGDDRIKIDFRQLRNSSRVSHTIELIEELQDQHPEHQFWFVIGSDLVLQLENWHRAQDLKKLAKFLVVPRPNYHPETEGFNLKILKLAANQQSDISSSALRDYVQKGADISSFCPSYIASYILEKKLYLK